VAELEFDLGGGGGIVMVDPPIAVTRPRGMCEPKINAQDWIQVQKKKLLTLSLGFINTLTDVVYIWPRWSGCRQYTASGSTYNRIFLVAVIDIATLAAPFSGAMSNAIFIEFGIDVEARLASWNNTTIAIACSPITLNILFGKYMLRKLSMQLLHHLHQPETEDRWSQV
jgi:hypothetical protein